MPDAVRNDTSNSQFTLPTAHGDAVLEYEMEGTDVVLTHTVVPDAARGEGVGTRLVAGALGVVREEGWKVVPQCPFVADYLREHADEQDLLAGRAAL